MTVLGIVLSKSLNDFLYPHPSSILRTFFYLSLSAGPSIIEFKYLTFLDFFNFYPTVKHFMIFVNIYSFFVCCPIISFTGIFSPNLFVMFLPRTFQNFAGDFLSVPVLSSAVYILSQIVSVSLGENYMRG